MTQEARDTKLRRLRMRSMRRGIKEMDIILIRFCDMELDGMDDATLAAYDTMLSENDQDLYQWVSGQAAPPKHLSALITTIRETALKSPFGQSHK
ncbi:MAG: succinate dehydrogenase assembly factor 2 [Marinovum sp.]|nr:succinate dehydrogenase assembly factor 2 [Marinovum sp.]